MADGRIVIGTELDEKGIETGLKDLEESLNGLKDLGGIFKGLSNSSNAFSRTFSSLCNVMSNGTAMAVAGVAGIVVAFNKLYEVSKQNFFNNLKNIGNTLKPVADLINAFASETLQVFSNIAGFEFSFSSLISEAIEFESSMTRVSSIMGVTGQGIKELSDSAREWGASTRYTATEVAEAYKYMGMAGFSLQESLSSIGDILNLTTIGATELGIASDIVTDGLTALGMSADQAGNFVDYMAATITRSNTDVEMMGETLKYAGSVAGTLGVSMDDLSVAIGLMANSSIKASQAGTSMRTLLANLSAPTDTVAGAMEKYGISLIKASDGSVDLDATLRNLRSSLKSLPLTEQTAACKDLAGKTGMTGLMAIVNATDEAYDSLTSSVQNATETVSYWNENLGQVGITGKECSDRIETLKKVLSETEHLGSAFNMTTQDMALALQVLGSDAKITSNDIKDLFNVLSVMREPNKKQSKVMKELGLTYREVGDDAFGYSETCSMVDSSIIGLTQSQKKQIKSQLDANMSLDEANNILKKYNLTAKTTSTGQIDFIANLKQLRSKFKDMDDATRKSTLSNLGLSNSFDEINEVCNMSDETFDMYCKNLELATGLSKKMADAMDETTKQSLLILSSAMTDVGIELFESLKSSIVDTADALANFFTIWRNGDLEGKGEATYSFDNFKLAIDNLLQTIRNADISGAIGDAISGAVTFITQGGLSGILSIGGEIINQISQGIIQNKDNIANGISSLIKQVSNFITEYAPQIEEAGIVIMDAIKMGIENNRESIRSALDAICDVMSSWVRGSTQIKAITGEFASVLIDSFVEQSLIKMSGKADELNNGIMDLLGNSLNGPLNSAKDVGSGIWDGLKYGFDIVKGWFVTEAHADEFTSAGQQIGDQVTHGIKMRMDENGNVVYQSAQSAGKESAKGISDGAKEGINDFGTIVSDSFNQALSSMTTSASQMTSITDTIRSSFLGISNIINNQMSSARNVFTSQCLSMSAVARNQMPAVANSVRNEFLNVSNIINNQISNARNIFTQKAMSMVAVARNQCPAITTSFRTNFLNVTNIVRNQMSATRNVFTEKCLSMAAVARNQSNAIVESFRGCASQAYSAGIAIGQGLGNGILVSGAVAVAKARSIANQVSAAMKSALDINSPSKVTTEIGEFTTEGLIVGMDNKQSDLVKSVKYNMSDMASRLKTAVNLETAKVSARVITSTQSSYINSSNYNDKFDRVIEAIENMEGDIYMDGDKVGKKVAPSVKKYNEIDSDNMKRLEGRW